MQIWEEYLLEQMKKAGEEERQIALKKGHLMSDGTPYITVIADGGWSKRTYGHGYNAASGVVSACCFHISFTVWINIYLFNFRV